MEKIWKRYAKDMLKIWKDRSRNGLMGIYMCIVINTKTCVYVCVLYVFILWYMFLFILYMKGKKKLNSKGKGLLGDIYSGVASIFDNTVRKGETHIP